jgi:nicotinamidase-related amidase
MKPALLVIDVQTHFFDEPVSVKSLERATWYINAAIALFREKDLPVICIQHTNPKGGFTQESEGFEVHKDIKVLESDPHIIKTYGNAFNKTDLGKLLSDLGVDTLVITGYMAENCVLSTYRGALDLDLAPIILRGSIVSHIPEHEKFVENIGNLVTIGALRKFLE